MIKEFLLVIAGGFCSAIGGFAAIWYQTKKARQTRFEEMIGEQKLEVYKKALSLIDQIQTLLIQGVTDDVLKVLYDNGEWFSMNQILLPHTFVENWRSMRLNLRSVKRKDKIQERTTDESKQNEIKADVVGIEDFVQKLVDEAEKTLRKELKLPEVKIKRWKKTNET